MRFLPLFLLGAALCLPSNAQSHKAGGDTDDSGVLPAVARCDLVLAVVLLDAPAPSGSAIILTAFGPVFVDRETGQSLVDTVPPDYTEIWTSNGSTCTMVFWKKTSESPEDFARRCDCAVKAMQKLKPKDPPSTGMVGFENLLHRAA